MDAKKVEYDPVLLGAILGLVGFGLVMVYSASAVTSHEKLGDSFFYLKRQAVAAAVGLVAMVTAMKLGYRRMARLAYPLLLLSIVLLVAVLIPGLGSKLEAPSVGSACRFCRSNPPK
jgi:cell division protein FtsW